MVQLGTGSSINEFRLDYLVLVRTDLTALTQTQARGQASPWRGTCGFSERGGIAQCCAYNKVGERKLASLHH